MDRKELMNKAYEETVVASGAVLVSMAAKKVG